jgi:crotonobetainyl-CoA:carnitine CoA-transferase CaiB-like acyl-CoA transferase
MIEVSISGVGESGRYAGKRVYDPVFQGLSDVVDLQADPQTPLHGEANTADPTARPELILATADGYIMVGTISDSE